MLSPAPTARPFAPCVLALALLRLASTPGVAADRPPAGAFGIFDVPPDSRSLEALDELGVGWVRVQHRLGDPAATARVGELLQIAEQLFDADRGLWLTLYHRDPDNVDESGTVGFAASERGGFGFRDRDRFVAQLEAFLTPFRDLLLERGKRPGNFLVVQLGNEVTPRDIAPPDNPVRFFHGTADQYLELLAAGSEAVRATDPTIAVAAGGIASSVLDEILEGDPALASWNERLLTEGRFDWADVHLRHRLEDVPAKVAWVRTRWRGALAATELAGPDPRVATYSESAQAEELPERIRIAREAGVSRVFWPSLVESGEEVFFHEGLIEAGTWRRKEAFVAYADLIAGELAAPRCVPEPAVLCLQENRFRLAVDWRDFEGTRGIGWVIPATDESGEVWFFAPTNLELLLKVLDGRALNGHYWFFYGALTNVELEIRVEDLVRGTQRIYTNPLGQFASVGDITALPD